jgi:amidohydrolase
MDALHVHEKNGFAHASQNRGKMHACGHDGHTTMLLGAARYLAETRNFAGTVHFIFQPAEENEGGGGRMVEEGLFEKFPVDSVFGMHNWPGLPVGEFVVRPGPMMAAFDLFEITVRGKGAHAAMPHQGVDPVVVAAQIVSALQTIASRNTHPLESAVVSVTQIHGGDTFNVLPDEVVLGGTTRSFKPEVQDLIEANLRRAAESTAAAYGASVAVRYERRYPPTVNAAAETELAAAVLGEVVGEAKVRRDALPSMGGEDFAFMLQKRPGSYIWIGNGESASLHNSSYDFNDEILPLGASYWARLVERALARPA